MIIAILFPNSQASAEDNSPIFNGQPAYGDLAIYSLGYQANLVNSPGPTIFLLIDPSLYLNRDSSQQLIQLQQTLQYLMETPGVMADNLQVGIGMLDGSMPNGLAKLIRVPVEPLGSVANSESIESQRYKIKKFIINNCLQFPDCEGGYSNQLSASANSTLAYALAGAYMMGTETDTIKTFNQNTSTTIGNRVDLNNNYTLPLETRLIGSYQNENLIDDIRTRSPDLRQLNSLQSANAGYSKPIYNQCSAKYFTGANRNINSNTDLVNNTQSAVDLDHKVGNAIIIIASDSPPILNVLNSSSIVNPLMALSKSLSPYETHLSPPPSSDNNNLLPKQCQIEAETALIDTNSDSALYGYCSQQYARHLNQFNTGTLALLNPAGLSLKTGVISFASIDQAIGFAAKTNNLPQYDCASAVGDSKQRCLLGQYGQLYGEGGYFQSLPSTQTELTQSLRLAQSLLIMVENLSAKPASLAMSSPIQLDNPMRKGHLLTDGYLPFLQPKFGSYKAQWPGGVRKYKHSAEGFKDKNNRLIKKQHSVISAIIDAESKDLWSKRMTGVNYTSSLTNSNTSTQPRNLYLSQSQSGTLTAQSQQNLANYSFPSLSDEQQTELRHLLFQYLTNSSKPSGGINHSKPLALISKASVIDPHFVNLTATKSSNTNISPSHVNTSQNEPENGTRFHYKKHILYGGMDNAVHIIDDDSGEEVAAYFPKEVLLQKGQFQAITRHKNAQSDEAMPSFGVDSAWTQYVRYATKSNGDKVAKQLYVFGGSRLGAKAYYGLDLTGLDKVMSASELNGFSPKQLFSITPDRQDFADLYFKRLGYSWGTPIITHINWYGEPTLVAILSGGYDAKEYDKPDALRALHYSQNDQQPTLGNAIYVVNAQTGEPLITITGNEINGNTGLGVSDLDNKGFTTLPKGTAEVLQVKHHDMAYSIPGSVKAMDRDEDALTDHLYFADLEGQLFRIDIDNVASSKTEASRVRAIRLADFRSNSNLPGPRFYETPAVTIQKHTTQNGTLTKFATVTVASGDRSHPLRISDPSNQTVAIEIVFTDKSNNRQLIKAVYKAYISDYKDLEATTDGQVVVDERLMFNSTFGDWELSYSDLSIKSEDLNQGIQFDEGKFLLSKNFIHADSLITATTTFASTDQVTASIHTTNSLGDISNSLDNNQQKSSWDSIKDPLAPKIEVSNQWVSIEPIGSTGISAASKAANFVYTLYDKDIATVNLFGTATSKLTTRNITLSEETFPDITGIDVDNSTLSGYHKNGWRAPLIQFGPALTKTTAAPAIGNKLSNANHLSRHSIKAFGPIFALHNKVYLTAYNPTPNSTPLLSCRPQVIGRTEVYQFCLPYGSCNTENKKYASHIQRLAYGNGMIPLSWKTDNTGKNKQLFSTNTLSGGLDPEQSLSFIPLNDLASSPKFVNAFTVKPQLKFEQWLDYSRHTATAN